MTTSNLLVDRAGRMFLWQPDDYRILVFNQRGQRIDSIGRSGEGPGEFRMMTLGGFKGSALWVSDPMTRRTSFFDSGARFIGARSWPGQVGLGGESVVPMFGVQPHGIQPNGTEFVVLTLSPREAAPSWWPEGEQRAALIVVDTLGRIQQTVMTVPDLNPDRCFVKYVAVKTGPGVLRTPFCSEGTTAVADDSTRFASVTFPSSQDFTGELRLRVALSSGVVAVDQSISLEQVRVPRAAADSIRNHLLQNPGPRGVQPEKRAVVRKLHIPEFYPPVRDMVVGQDQTIWLGSWPDGSNRWWLVLNPNGRPLGRVRLPASFEVYAASLAKIWGTEKDRDGIPSIVRYSVTPTTN